MNDRIGSNQNLHELEPELQDAVSAILAEPIDMDRAERAKTSLKNLKLNGVVPAKSERAEAVSSAPRRSAMLLKLGSVAAALLVVATLVVMRTESSAFADVMQKIRTAGAVRYITLIETADGDDPIRTETVIAADGRKWQKMNDTVTIFDKLGRLGLILHRDMKRATVPAPQPANEKLAHTPGVVNWFEALRNQGDEPDKSLGLQKINGIQAEGFLVKQGNHEYKVWIDAKEKSLVRIELGQMVEGSGIKNVIMQEFQFDEQVDESLFSTQVPKGYTAVTQPAMNFEIGEPEQNLASALRGYTNLSDGKFPDSISEWGDWAALFAKDGDLSESDRETMGRLGAVTPFLASMPHDDYEYVGKGKTTADKKGIVFWYRTEKGPTRAIYTDLSVGDVPEGEKLPSAK